MKIYTRNGDDGSTGLFGGERVSKHHLRVRAYGAVDETNSAVGLARAATEDPSFTGPLADVQHRLFDIGADLATPGDSQHRKKLPQITTDHLEEMEAVIDAALEEVPPLKKFVLPGGSELAARLHMARTICRRAERGCVGLAGQEPIGDQVVPYLNRLSDMLFALARLANHRDGCGDVTWG